MDEWVDRFVRTEDPKHAATLAVLDFWRSRVAHGQFIVGRDIPSRPLAPYLHSMLLTEPLPDVSDIRIHLAGEMVRRRFGDDIVGNCLSRFFPPADFERHRADTREILREKKPIVLDSRVSGPEGIERMHLEVLLLPVTARDLTATWVLAGMFYFN